MFGGVDARIENLSSRGRGKKVLKFGNEGKRIVRRASRLIWKGTKLGWFIGADQEG